MTARNMTGMLMVAAAALFALAGPAAAITVTSHTQNAACYQGMQFDDLEFENPLTGSEMVLDHRILEWRDADYMPGTPSPYDDWIAHDMGGSINGNVAEVWMRMPTQWIETSTTVASTIVSIHMVGDGNDGLAEVYVDGSMVASMDMGTAGQDRLLILVKDLANTTHNIEVRDTGVGGMGGIDVHTLGAAALDDPEYKWQQLPRNTRPTNLFYGWNEPSVYEMQVAADDWACKDDNPISDIHWWGSFVNWKSPDAPAVVPNRWHITIWSDTPQGPNDPFSHPNQVAWEHEYAYTPGTFVGWDYDPRSQSWDACFKWDLTLPMGEWFSQAKHPSGEPGIYWLSIAAVYDAGMPNEYPWGWKTRPRETNSEAPDAAVDIYSPTMPHLNDYYSSGAPIMWENQQWDLAFELSATPWEEKWAQLPDEYADYYYGWDEPSMYSKGQIISDDWICTDDRKVTDIHWWGSYPNWIEQTPPTNGPENFHVAIWTDYAPGLPFPHPNQCIWEYTIARSSTKERYVKQDYYPGKPSDSCFVYDLYLPQDKYFQQQTANGRYWLTVSAKFTGTPQRNWGWKTRPHLPHYGFPAVKITNPTAPVVGSLYANGSQLTDPQGNLMDVSFVLATMGTEYMKWSQPPQPYTSGNFFDGWDDPSVYDPSPGTQIDADDWACTTRDPVSDIRWWGSFIGWSEAHPPQMPDAFHIAIWDDVPKNLPLEPFSHPRQVLREYECTNYTWKLVGWDIDPRDPTAPPEACFKFEWDMPKEEWFCQGEGDHTYWLSIAARYNMPPTQYLWGWKTRMRDPLSDAPDAAVTITNTIPIWPPVMGCQYASGFPIMWPNGTDKADLSFALSTVPVGSLTFTGMGAIVDHKWWWRDSDLDNEMLAMTVSADPYEPITWDTLKINAFGTGNDAADILQVDVWIDNNGDNQVDALDTHVGSGVYPANDGSILFNIATIPGGTPVVIPAGSFIRVLVAYRMNTAAPQQGKTYAFRVISATGTGKNSGCPVRIYGLPITSATKTTHRSLTIGEAKLLPLGSEVLLEDKELTADLRPPGWPIPWNWFYIEECQPNTMRANGIGVIDGTTPAMTIGDLVSLTGRTVLVNTAELMIQPNLVLVTAHRPTITALGTNNKSSGGGVYGAQPTLYDNDLAMALPIPAFGLSDVGSLVRLWGRVTGYGGVSLGGGNMVDVFWMDDGSVLHDGYITSQPPQQPSLGVAVVTPRNIPQPPIGIWGVTGIMRAIQNPRGYPVRLLVPRDYPNDMTWYAP